MSVDIRDREAVRNLFNSAYYSGVGIQSGWSGRVIGCDAGETSPQFQEAVRTRINFFRAMAGVPADIEFDPVLSAKARQAALIVSANLSILHSPLPTFSCLSPEGIEAAAASNLALSTSGIDSIEAYIMEAGANHRVGHRRWLLYPQTTTMGNADIDPPDGSTSRRANANWVFDDNFGGPRPATRDDFVAWPPPGFVPHKLVFPRWSFSYPRADFAGATVTVRTNGVALPIYIEPIERGYGENSIVFVPGAIAPSARTHAPRPAADLTYEVTISNVLIGTGATNFSYTVTVFDPEVRAEENVAPAIIGSAQPEMLRTNRFQITSVTEASGYDFRIGILVPYKGTETAESVAGIEARTATVYPVVQTNIFASGRAAFHLAHVAPPRPQSITLKSIFVPSMRSELGFKSRLGAASTGQVARVQVSLDEGMSWRDIYAQFGDGLSGELSFTNRSVSLSQFAGRAIRIRFEYGFPFGDISYAPGTGEQIGWYIDDIAVVSAQELFVAAVVPTEEPEFRFVPQETRSYYLDARPRFFELFAGEWTAGKTMTAVEPSALPTIVHLTGVRVTPQYVDVEFDPASARPGALFQIEQSFDLGKKWTPLFVVPEAASESSRQVFRVPPGNGSARFFRVTVN